MNPTAHGVQTLALSVENVIAAHVEQLEAALWEENLPTAQLTHWVPPVVSLKVPEAQLVHALAPAEE